MLIPYFFLEFLILFEQKKLFEKKYELKILQLKATSPSKEKTPNLIKMKLVASNSYILAKNDENSKILKNSKNSEKILQK